MFKYPNVQREAHYDYSYHKDYSSLNTGALDPLRLHPGEELPEELKNLTAEQRVRILNQREYDYREKLVRIAETKILAKKLEDCLYREGPNGHHKCSLWITEFKRRVINDSHNYMDKNAPDGFEIGLRMQQEGKKLESHAI